MCFHYSLTKERAEIEIQLGAHWDDQWEPLYYVNGFSFPKLPVITQKDPEKIQLFNWGLIPHWVKTRSEAEKIRTQTLNARSETVFEKPSFRSYINNNRCLIIADGFFEWMDLNTKKYPHYIYLKDKKIFCFAGIYAPWTDKSTGEHIESFSILTSRPNSMLAKIHNIKERMPVIVPPPLYKKWLTPGLSKEEITSIFIPYPETEMQNHSIRKFAPSGDYNLNVPDLLDPVSYSELALIK